MAEEWRDIAGYEGSYAVSNLGRVKSLARTIYRKDQSSRTHAERILRPGTTYGGYKVVSLRKNLKGRTRAIHILVIAAFTGPRPEGFDVRHLDGNPANNVPENLQYGTRTENMRDKIRHGTHYHLNLTECLRGHPFSPANTYVTSAGQRACRACCAMRQRIYRQRRKDKTQSVINQPTC